MFLGLFLDFSLVFRLSACIPVSIPSYLISLRILLSTRKASPRTHISLRIYQLSFLGVYFLFTLHTDIFRWRLSVLNTTC